MKITHLKTEYKTNPLGLDTQNPRLSWEISTNRRGVLQTAYHIKAASYPDDLEKELLIWDSGKVQSGQSIHVEYSGSKLTSGQRVYWKIKAWDNQDNESDWSEVAYWEMGMLKSTEWKASWIEADIDEDTSDSTPCPYLRKDFILKGEVESARIYASSYGLYQLSLNGKKIGDQLFTPGWTSYKHRVQYQVFDVTSMLKPEGNALGAILGDGWYRGYIVWQGNKNYYGDKLALLVQMQITYKDGSSELVITDQSWKSLTGPILKSDIYNGEVYDARLEKNGWDSYGFDDSKWAKTIVKDFGKSQLVASEGSPVRITESIKPVSKIITPKGELVFDLGQNIVGWCSIQLKGRAGSKITLKHAEVLDCDGNFYTDNLRAAKSIDQYIFKGDGLESYQPHFTFHGFRYIMIEDYEGEITKNNITGMVVHSDMEPTGHFECSDELINRLQQNIQWSLRGNFLDVPTDCPQRDERLGWTGDAQIFTPTACFNMNTAPFFIKWMKDYIFDQKSNGSVPWVIPNVIVDGGGTGWSDGFGSTGWGDAAVIIPWIVYQVYGDKRILEHQYESMKSWVEYMRREAGDTYLFNTGFHLGDWLSFSEYYSYKYYAPDYGYAGANTDKDFIATAYFYYSTSLLCKIAGILGKQEDEKDYADLLPRIKNAFLKEFMTPTGRLSPNTQTAYIMALAFDLIPEKQKKNTAQRLAGDINYFGHLTTGFLGTSHICHVLSANGYPDVAYMLLFNKKYPSWLFPVTKGATTIWERWDGIKPDGSFQNVGMNSFNHYAYGAIGNWLYTNVAGIRTDEHKPGYKYIIINPYPIEKLKYARAEYRSMYGRIVSGWEYQGKHLKLNVVIPPNTSAKVFLPALDKENITESGTPLTTNIHIKCLANEEGKTVVEIGSGKYDFEIITK